ncbi:hypothetical protein [Hansschlegelia zhihuaiae]|uniref:Uncharacterized protein n=1 Tax=Hansschlegelia zhihuaiae TaxID=405005 RepID=A0A4V1KIW3_9HYPH|nr:hypothetical protein [Hansschlegelia zhihuaiae]RXF72092.1 hypothetical protein EK403_14885 [Hansschlegelia zhihuaiae]
MLAGFLPAAEFRDPPEAPLVRARRMWRERRSIALIAVCTGLEPHEIREACRDIARPAIPNRLDGRVRLSEAPQGAAHALLGVSSLTCGRGSGPARPFPDRHPRIPLDVTPPVLAPGAARVTEQAGGVCA